MKRTKRVRADGRINQVPIGFLLNIAIVNIIGGHICIKIGRVRKLLAFPLDILWSQHTAENQVAVTINIQCPFPIVVIQVEVVCLYLDQSVLNVYTRLSQAVYDIELNIVCFLRDT